MRKWIVDWLLRLACWVEPELSNDTLMAYCITTVSNHVAARHMGIIKNMMAAYYVETSIPPEDAMIVIQRNKGEWQMFICPRDQDFEMEAT